MRRPAARATGGDAGQVIVLFAIAVTALFILASLVFDAGGALVLRRRMQDAGDAAAIAAANVIQSEDSSGNVGCRLASSSDQTKARTEIESTALASVRTALGTAWTLGTGTPTSGASEVTVTCPSGWSNYAVDVTLTARSAGAFGGVLGLNGFAVTTLSRALNGPIGAMGFSVVELNPYSPSFASAYSGCPSIAFSGGPTAYFEGSVFSNSTCTTGNGGAFDAGGTASIYMVDTTTQTPSWQPSVKVAGGFATGSEARIFPTGRTFSGVAQIADPLEYLGDLVSAGTFPPAGYPAGRIALVDGSVGTYSMPLSGTTPYILEPGVYDGGIQLSNQAVVYLKSGIYILKGGGLNIGAQNKVYSIPYASGTSLPTLNGQSWSDGQWPQVCLPGSCGVLIYNTRSSSDQSGTLGAVKVNAGATLKLRPYSPDADPNLSYVVGIKDNLKNLLLWQDGTLPPNDGKATTNTPEQTQVTLSGGGSVDLRGTIYTPKAKIYMTGGSGGSGGSGTNITVQFISWDLEFNGNSSFRFYYRAEDFARPPEYGLIK